MTIIAAYYRSPADFAIGADSACVDIGGTARFDDAEKLHRWGPVLFGCAGELALVQRAARFIDDRAGTCCQGRKVFERTLIELHDHLLTRVAAPQPCYRSANSGCAFLAVAPWGITWMDGAGGLYRPPVYGAIGSGAPEAKGAMFAAFHHVAPPPSPAEFVQLAVDAAIALDAGCGGPVRVLRSEG